MAWYRLRSGALYHTNSKPPPFSELVDDPDPAELPTAGEGPSVDERSEESVDPAQSSGTVDPDVLVDDQPTQLEEIPTGPVPAAASEDNRDGDKRVVGHKGRR